MSPDAAVPAPKPKKPPTGQPAEPNPFKANEEGEGAGSQSTTAREPDSSTD